MNTVASKTNSTNLSVREGNKKKFNINLLLNVFIITAILLGGAYIKLSSSLATRGFELEELKNERLTILQELEKIEVSAAIPTSLYALKSSEIVQEMPDVKSQKFLQVMEGQVAIK